MSWRGFRETGRGSQTLGRGSINQSSVSGMKEVSDGSINDHTRDARLIFDKSAFCTPYLGEVGVPSSEVVHVNESLALLDLI